jgi:hypothetical protein
VTRWYALVPLALAVACGADPAAPETPPPIEAALAPSDVSILMPLPAASERLSLLGPDARGARGPLLPRDLYGQLPELEIFSDNVDTYDLLRVVGIRLDPCFPTLDPSSADGCKSMVRLVMQPIRLVAAGDALELRAVDAAVHLFYAVDEADLEDLLAWLVAARRDAVSDGRATLGVHPALTAQGLDGPFMTTLRSRLLAAIGGDNLTRVTVMALGDFGNVWTFAGFDVKGDTLEPFVIPTLAASSQSFTNVDATGATFSQTKLVPPGVDQDIALLLDSDAALAAPPSEAQAPFTATLRIENPRLENPDTIDCATCHIAPAARRWAETALALDAADFAEEYRDPAGLPVEGATGSRTDELRMFGYFDSRPSVSRRVVNETDALVRFWNAKLGLD